MAADFEHPFHFAFVGKFPYINTKIFWGRGWAGLWLKKERKAVRGAAMVDCGCTARHDEERAGEDEDRVEGARHAAAPGIGMHIRLQRSLWVARVLAVALGLLVVAALLHRQQGRAAAGLLSDAVEPPPGAERADPAQPWGAEDRRPAVPDDEGVLEADRAREEHAGQLEAAYSLARIARLLGWGRQDHDDIEEEHDGDRIRIRDWRPAEDLAGLQGQGRAGQTTEWTDNALLRAFIARFGVARTTSAPSPSVDLEMRDFASTAAAPLTVAQLVSSTTGTAQVENTPYPLLPFCPLNGIITSQSPGEGLGGDVATGVLEYSAAWLVSRGVGAGWRSALVPEAVLRQLSHLSQHLSLSAVEQLPPTCRPGPHVLEDGSAALGSADLADLQALPARFLDPEAPLVIRRGVLLPRLLATHLSPLRDELSLRPEVRLAARYVLDICRQRLRLPAADGAVDKDEDESVAFVALHVRRRSASSEAPWWDVRGQPRMILGPNYFLAAMDRLRSRLQRRGVTPVFVVATDDPGWVRENLPPGEDMCVTETEGGPRSAADDYVGFAVQASCQHAILDRSSKAVATALFVEGEVVYRRGVAGLEPDLSKMPGWVGI
ncbi:Galactoside alpha-(1,2)-fucosyltransferase 1 [Frankliniella fusca]|uniref:L-Fucosyltransferase n=1 Tax=Frankliniella fusca TaxID=407009 RepID=A0AAE1HB12_9NEOP|nr:Galactoside alpha-(1,2)-fucosyltransferase 1 [Frankliniella fusca]